MAKHHNIPRSRHGPDDEWNLVELNDYEHAYTHAVDFVLFEHAPMFDCRQPGWPLLPDSLREAVCREIGNRMRGNQYAIGHGGPRGERNGNYGKSPCLGRKHTQEAREAISEKLTGKPKSPEHRRKLSEAKLGIKTGPQPPNNPNRINGALKGWETRDKEHLRKRMRENNPGAIRVCCPFCRKETTKPTITQFHKHCKPQ